jgi:hypothetical protein
LAKRNSDDSILIKSAETVGRAVGSLQRALNQATERIVPSGMKATPDATSSPATDATTNTKPRARKTAARKAAARKGAGRKAAASNRRSAKPGTKKPRKRTRS